MNIATRYLGVYAALPFTNYKEVVNQRGNANNFWCTLQKAKGILLFLTTFWQKNATILIWYTPTDDVADRVSDRDNKCLSDAAAAAEKNYDELVFHTMWQEIDSCIV